jgi:acetolactate decarboxylase
LYGTLENQEVEMLGFYSNKHHAIFTHHTTNMHIHVKSKKVIGHIDDMTLGIDMMLKIPK